MARQNPLGKIKDLTVETLKVPSKVAGMAVGQAKGAAAAGLHVADHVTRSAVSTVGTLVQQRRSDSDPAPDPAPVSVPEPEVQVEPDEPVNVVEELDLDAAPVTKPKKKPAKKTPPRKAAAAPTSIDAAAESVEVDVTPADVAKKVAKKAPGKKAAAKKSATTAPAKKAAAKKSPAKKAATTSPSGKLPARKKPLSAAEVAGGAGTEVITPVGTRGADVATNPSTTETDLQQTGTEPIMDPATTKAVKAEQATLSAAADTDKG